MTWCFKSAMTFAVINFSITGGTGLTLTSYSELKDKSMKPPGHGDLDAEMADDTDWRSIDTADRSLDITEQLEVPSLETDSGISARNKREPYHILREKGNRYKEVPDFQTGPPPTPGHSLDDSIFESNGDRYRGLSLRLKGAAADLTATTQFHVESWSYQPALTDNMEALRMIQSHINRIKLQSTPTPLRNITRPPIAAYFDPNMNTIRFDKDGYPAMMEHVARRMMDPNNDAWTVPRKMIPIKQMSMFPWHKFNAPLLFNSKPNPMNTIDLPTIRPDEYSPVQVFKQKMGLTTMRRSRTRKPKTTIAPLSVQLLPLREDEFIPQEMDENSNLNVQDLPDEQEMDKDEFKVEHSDKNTRISNIPEQKYVADTKILGRSESKAVGQNRKEADILNTKNINTEPFNWPDLKAMKDKNLVEDLKSFDTDPLEKSQDMKKIDKLNLKSVSRKLKKILEHKMEEEKHKKRFNLSTSHNSNVHSTDYTQKEEISITNPILAENEPELNEEVKRLLFINDEMNINQKAHTLPEDKDYEDNEDIKGLPIRRRRKSTMGITSPVIKPII